MRRYWFHTILLLTALLFTSCRPNGVLSKQDMIDVLFDIHLVEAMTYNPYGSVSPDWAGAMNEFDFTDLAYRSVLKKHDITEEAFFASVKYYSKKLRVYKRMYQDLDEMYALYIQDMDTWTGPATTDDAGNKQIIFDEKQIREVYEYMHIKPDTALKKPYTLLFPDTVKVMRWRQASRLMKRKLRVKQSFTMKGVNNGMGSAADSTANDVREAIEQGEVPTVDVLLKQALPIEDVLRLREAGAYDPLMPKSVEESKPVDRSNLQERRRVLRRRSTDQR